MIEVSVKYEGAVFTPNFVGKFQQAMINTIARICQTVKDAAIEDYLNKKRSEPKLPSLIVDSFTYDIPFANISMVRGIVFAGVTPAASAPWAVYVDQGHSLRNGAWWDGYNFMAVGEQAGRDAAQGIINDEFADLKSMARYNKAKSQGFGKDTYQMTGQWWGQGKFKSGKYTG